MGEMTDRQLLEQLLKNQEEFRKNQEEFRKNQEEFRKNQEEFRKNQEEFRTELSELKKEQEDMKSDIRSMKLVIENDISPTLQLLLQMQLDDSKRFIRLEKSVQKLEDDYVIDEVIKDLKLK